MSKPKEYGGTLHVYGPRHHHDESVIVGDAEGLRRLADAIDSALAGIENPAKTFPPAKTFAADGEAYDTHVVCVERKVIDELTLPYTDKDYQRGGKSPMMLVHGQGSIVHITNLAQFSTMYVRMRQWCRNNIDGMWNVTNTTAGQTLILFFTKQAREKFMARWNEWIDE